MAGTITPFSWGVKNYLELGVPDQYNALLHENAELVKQLFPLSNEVDKKLVVELLHFLDMYREIFAHSAGFTSSDGMAMKKFREIYRKRFRGVSYLSLDMLANVHIEASAEAVSIAQRTGQATPGAELNDSITQEQTWIGRINTFKRDQVVFSIKSDAFESFRERIHQEFPFNPSNEMQFYDHVEMEVKFDEMRESAVQGFLAEIPFENDKTVMNGLGNEFMDLLNSKVLNHLFHLNAGNRSKAKTFMDALIDDLEKMYRSNVNVIQKCPLMEVQEITKLHTMYREDCQRQFHERELPGYSLFQEVYERKLEEKLYEAFKDILEKAQAAARVRIHASEKKSKAEVDACVEKITDIFKKHCEGGHVGQIKRTFDIGLDTAIKSLQDTTIANEEKMRSLLANTDPAKKASPVEKANSAKIQAAISNSTPVAETFNRRSGNSSTSAHLGSTIIIQSKPGFTPPGQISYHDPYTPAQHGNTLSSTQYLYYKPSTSNNSSHIISSANPHRPAYPSASSYQRTKLLTNLGPVISNVQHKPRQQLN